MSHISDDAVEKDLYVCLDPSIHHNRATDTTDQTKVGYKCFAHAGFQEIKETSHTVFISSIYSTFSNLDSAVS